MAITFKLRVDNPKIKDLRSFVRKTVTRDRTQYTDSQWDSETSIIDYQRNQLKEQFGWLWDMENEVLIQGEFGHLKITDTEISFKPKKYAPTEIWNVAKWYCMTTQHKYAHLARLS